MINLSKITIPSFAYKFYDGFLFSRGAYFKVDAVGIRVGRKSNILSGGDVIRYKMSDNFRRDMTIEAFADEFTPLIYWSPSIEEAAKRFVYANANGNIYRFDRREQLLYVKNRSRYRLIAFDDIRRLGEISVLWYVEPLE